MTGTQDATVELCLPADWCDVLLDEGPDPRFHMEQVVRRTWPTCPPSLWEGSVAVLLRWREDMLARGTVSHGIVSASTDDGAAVRWHIVSSVVALPRAPEIDLSAVLSQYVRATHPEIVHVETFETEMGMGVGLIGHPQVTPPDGLSALGIPAVHDPVRLGMAAALSYAPAATHGLLVLGLAVAPEQVAELAGLIAVIAGRSRLHAEPAPAAETDR
jgi:hypothetical protein